MSATELEVRPRAEVYAAGPTKRATRAEMAHRRATLLELAREAQPASVRHVYYRAVVAGLVEKNDNGYSKVQRMLLSLRRDGELPFSWITDDGRQAHWPLVKSSPASALHYLAYSYRRDPWQLEGAPRVEVWCESSSIAGVLLPLKDEYAVPIFPIKGQSSETFAHNAATSYKLGQRTVVLYAGDYDPHGLQIASQLEGKLHEYAAEGVELEFVKVAITDDQATTLQALGTPAKQNHWKDYHGERHEFAGQAIELEAVDPAVMRQMFAQHITTVATEIYGYDIFSENMALEHRERGQLLDVARGWSA